MNSESIVTVRREAKVLPFLYPDAPWEAGPLPAGSLFREIGPVEAAGRIHEPAPPIPVRYEYRVEAGFETDLGGESDAAKDDIPEGGAETVPEAPAEREEDRHFKELLASECSKAEERGRSRGMEVGLAEGRQAGREEAIRQLHAGIEGERHRLAERTEALLRSFAGARDGYIHRLEQESARLALAIAARILRREAQSDPLLLTGAVRVALGQLATSTVVRLRVPVADLTLWTEALTHMPNLAIRPEVIGDPKLVLGECRMETELGSADLGLDAQLEVLERGFFEHDESVPLDGLAEEEIRSDAETVPQTQSPSGAADGL